MNIKPITLQDAEEAYDSVKDNGNPSQGDITYCKELCRFDDGKALFFCAGTLYDGDSFDHYCRLGIENPNAVLADFEFDYAMPWDSNNEYGDVVDTEISLPITQSDVDWLNKEANDIVKGYESGELVVNSRKSLKSSEDKEKYWGAFGENGCVDFLTRKEFIERFGEEPKDEDALDYVDSGCHGKDKKDKKKKPVKSSMSVEELPREALQELKQRYYAEKYDEDLSYGELADIDNIVSDEEVFDEYGGTSFTEDDFFCLANSRKAVKSSMPGKEKGIQAIMDEYGCTREEAIEIMNEEIQSSRKAVKSGLYDEANAFDPKDYDFGKVYNFIYDKYSKRIDRELNDLLYNIQEELGITTGDTFYDDNVEQCIKKLVEILADQYGNRS